MSADAKRPEAEEKSSAAERPPDELPTDLWAVSYDEDDDRELTTSQIEKALARKEIDEATLVWHPGMPEWQPLKQIEELRALLDTSVSIADDSVGEPAAEKPKSLPPAPDKPLSDPPPSSAPTPADEKPKLEKSAAAEEKESATREKNSNPQRKKSATRERNSAPQKKRREPPSAAPTTESSSKLPLVVLACIGVAIVVWLTRGDPAPPKATAELAPGATTSTTPPAITTPPVPPPPIATAAPAPVASEPVAPASPASSGARFDRIAAMKVLSRDEFHASRCRARAEPPGTAQVNLTFDPSGNVSDARIIQRPYAATMTAKCIESKLKKTCVTPFQGDPVTLRVPVLLY